MPPAELVIAARAAWPGVDVPDAELASYLAARIPADADPRSYCTADLYLACAVARNDAAAVRAFESHCMRDLDRAITHLDGGSALAADVCAAVRARVLPPAAKIADYRGRGDLRGWLRVVAVREALQILRARRRETPLDRDEILAEKLESVPAALPDERGVYRAAFEAALATLTPRERNLLRQQYVYGATIDELAVLYNVHRATAARWSARVRETLLRRTRRHVGEALRLAGDDLDSVMVRIADHLDYSLRHTLSLES